MQIAGSYPQIKLLTHARSDGGKFSSWFENKRNITAQCIYMHIWFLNPVQAFQYHIDGGLHIDS